MSGCYEKSCPNGPIDGIDLDAYNCTGGFTEMKSARHNLILEIIETKDIETQEELAALLKGMLCHVNLIPLNPVTETGMQGTDRRAAAAFRDLLESMGIPSTVRRQLGSDIDAACGQLRKKYTEKI